MSNGGYDVLPTLPDIDAAFRGVGRGHIQDNDRSPPAPGSWGFSPLGSTPEDAPYVMAGNQGGGRTVAEPPPPPPPLDPLPEIRYPERKTVPGTKKPPPPPPERPTVSLPLKPRPEDRKPAKAPSDLLPGPRSALRFPPTKRTCVRGKPTDRFAAEQARREPWESGTFPCPPDQDLLEQDPEASRWWYGLPTWTDRGAAEQQVRDLQEALEDCVESVRKRALEQVTPFETMAQARIVLRNEIENLKREAAAWGAESLRNMRTFSILMVLHTNTRPMWFERSREEFDTLPRSAVEQEYDRRADKLEGLVIMLPTLPGYEDSRREWSEFVAGQRDYDEALLDLTVQYEALDKALKCAVLYRTQDRSRIAGAAAAVLHGDPNDHNNTGVLDGRYFDTRQQLKGALTRYDLGTLLCELMYRLCCALQRCKHLDAALMAVEAIEKFRHFGNRAVNQGAGLVSFGLISFDCDRHRRDPALEDDADGIVAVALSAAEHDCGLVDRLADERRPINWDSIATTVNGHVDSKDITVKYANDLEARINRRIGVSEVLFFLAEAAGYLAMALTIVKGGVGIWRKLVKKQPPKIPIGRSPVVPERMAPEAHESPRLSPEGPSSGVPAKAGGPGSGARSGVVADARVAKTPVEVMESPESLRAGGKLAKPFEMQGIGRYVRENPGEWSEGPLGKGSQQGRPSSEGGGLKWSELKNGNRTGTQIRYHPGTPRHYGGKPYWTIIRNVDGRSIRVDVTEDGVFPR